MRNISSLFRRPAGHANHRVLRLVEAVVRALGGEQLRVRAVLDDLAVIDVEDLVRVLDGAADVFLETERKVSRMFSLEERSRAVELYLTTPMTTAQVVECLGYPTRQCLERWLAMDPRYAGRMAKPIIPLETRRKAIELVLGGMQQKQAAKQLGVSVGAVHNWVRAYRRGGMAALQPRNQNAAQGGKSASVRPRGGADAGGGDDVEALRRRVEELELENALMREVVEARRKRPRRRPAAPVEQGEDDADRPAEAEVFAEVDGLLAAHSAEQLPLPPCQDRR